MKARVDVEAGELVQQDVVIYEIKVFPEVRKEPSNPAVASINQSINFIALTLAQNKKL